MDKLFERHESTRKKKPRLAGLGEAISDRTRSVLYVHPEIVRDNVCNLRPSNAVTVLLAVHFLRLLKQFSECLTYSVEEVMRRVLAVHHRYDCRYERELVIRLWIVAETLTRKGYRIVTRR